MGRMTSLFYEMENKIHVPKSPTSPKTLDGERRNPSFSGLPTDDAPTKLIH
jgi:hypothetical protein